MLPIQPDGGDWEGRSFGIGHFVGQNYPIFDRIAKNLDLNETQKAKLQAVEESFHEARKAMSQARVQTFDEVLELVFQ